MQINHCVRPGPSEERCRAAQAPPPGGSLLQEHHDCIPCLASFQWILSLMDSPGCSQSVDTSVDVVVLLSHGAIPPNPTQRSSELKNQLQTPAGITPKVCVKVWWSSLCWSSLWWSSLCWSPPSPAPHCQHPFAVSTGIISQAKGVSF